MIIYDELIHSKPLPFTGNINIIQSSEFDEMHAKIPFLECPDTNLKFIIDSGSNTSLISCDYMKPSEQYNDFAIAASNTRITIFGARYVDVNVGGEICQWKFLIADIRRNIIGCDFLKHFKFSYDFKNATLCHSEKCPKASVKEQKINWSYVNKQLNESDAPDCVKNYYENSRL